MRLKLSTIITVLTLSSLGSLVCHLEQANAYSTQTSSDQPPTVVVPAVPVPVNGQPPTIVVPAVPVNEQPQPISDGTGATQPNTGTGDPTDNWLTDANNFIDSVTSFIQDDVLGTIKGFLGAIGIPDLTRLGSSIMNSPTSSNPGTKVADTLENNSGANGSIGSYGIRDDQNMQAQRTAAIATAESTSLSKEAQNRNAQTLQQTKQDTDDNVQLGDDSQNLDVTQEIMKNISQQTALNAKVTQRLLRTTEQTKDNAAIGNVIVSQAAKEIAGSNTAQRRKDIATTNQASEQGGMMVMPGGFSMADSSASGSTWFTQTQPSN